VQAFRLPDGKILIPKRATGPGIIGDGYVAVPADDPEAKKWLDYYRRRNRPMPDAPPGAGQEKPRA
jgi:hypothetical protein